MDQISFEFDLNQRVQYDAAAGCEQAASVAGPENWRAGRIVAIILNEGGNYYEVLDVHNSVIVRVFENNIEAIPDAPVA